MTPAGGASTDPAPTLAARLAGSPAAMMVAAAFLFATMGVGVKFAGAEGQSTAEIVFARGTLGALLTAALARAKGVSLKTAVPMTHFWRSITGVVSLCLWFYALAHLPLATAMTLNYMSSVWLALFLIGGAAMLGTARVDGRLIGTVLAGFVGVALVLRPTIAHEQLWYGLLGLLSGVISATAYLQVAALAKSGEPELRIVFYFSLAGAVVGLLGTAIGGFHRPTMSGALWLVGIAAAATIAQWLMTRAYATGRMLVVASLQYLGIAFSTVYGALLFGDRIGGPALAGMLLIVVAGIAATRLRSQQQPKPAPVAESSSVDP